MSALKLGCTFDTLFLMMGFIYLVDKIQFMLISSHHICIRSIKMCIICKPKCEQNLCGSWFTECVFSISKVETISLACK